MRSLNNLAAMPAQPDVDAGLLAAAKAASSAVNDYASVCPHYEREVIAAIRDELRAAIDAAEKGAPEQAASRRPCAKCGGRVAEHRFRMGDGGWCECVEDCQCDSYVAEEGAPDA